MPLKVRLTELVTNTELEQNHLYSNEWCTNEIPPKGNWRMTLRDAKLRLPVPVCHWGRGLNLQHSAVTLLYHHKGIIGKNT